MHHGKHKAEILYMGVSQSQKPLVICWSLSDWFWVFFNGKNLGKKFGDVEKSREEITLEGEPLMPTLVQTLFSVSWFTVRANTLRFPREVCRFSICGGTPNTTGHGVEQPALTDPA